MRKYIIFLNEELVFADIEDLIEAIKEGARYQLISYNEIDCFNLIPHMLTLVEQIGSFRYLSKEEYNLINEL